MGNWINTGCIILTIFYIIGIFYKKCILDIKDYKDKTGYTESLEYIKRIEDEIYQNN